MQLSKALEGYKIAALAEGYSPLTLVTYQSALGTLIEYLGDKEIQTVRSDDLHNFMSFLVTDYIPERRNNPNNTTRLSLRPVITAIGKPFVHSSNGQVQN